jgi:hypothetical protein
MYIKDLLLELAHVVIYTEKSYILHLQNGDPGNAGDTIQLRSENSRTREAAEGLENGRGRWHGRRRWMS